MRDYLLYVLIALVVGSIAIVFGVSGISAEMFGRWGGLICFTALLFGYFIADNRSQSRRLSFWLLAAALLFTHVTIFVVIFAHVTHWKTIWFMGMFLELPVLAYATNRFRCSLRGQRRN
jgi:peptidoglycan/LPS O-acetylase OafA/YrhL